MLREKKAFRKASPILLVLLPLLISSTPGQPILRTQQAVIIYLDRNGNPIGQTGTTEVSRTYIVRTTFNTEELYGNEEYEIYHPLRGRSSPISIKDAEKTEHLIKIQKFDEAMETGNLILLRPLWERRADAKFMKQDDGSGVDPVKDGREYASVIFQNGQRLQVLGKASDPCEGGADTYVPKDSVIAYTHSHPSRKNETSIKTCRFYPQAPSIDDLKIVPSGQTRVVFGRGTDKVYIYDTSGVLAVLSTENYSH